MAGGFSAIDLSLLPAPDMLQVVDYEATLAAMLAELRARDPVFDALVESDPAYKILEVAAYWRTLAVQHVNDAARAVMPAYATGADLDNIAAIYGVARQVLQAGDATAVPPVAAVLESDSDLRRRMMLSFEGLSVAGPEGAYIFHALSAHPDVADVSVTSPEPGQVAVTVLSRAQGGLATSDLAPSDLAPSDLASADLLAVVASALEPVRPLTDQVKVQAARITGFEVRAELTVFSGPEAEIVRASAAEAVQAYVDAQHGLGRPVTLSGLYAALHVQGVQNVALAQPLADLLPEADEALLCRAVTVTLGGVYG